MFGFGPLELTLVVLIVLLLFGAKRITALLVSFGQGVRNFRGTIGDDERHKLPEETNNRPL